MQQSDCDDPFWVHDPILLLQVDRLIEFYPSIDMCANERMNAVSRFILYAGVLTAYVHKSMKPLAISVTIVATLAMLYYPKSDKAMLDLYFKQKDLQCNTYTQDNPFMNLLPLDNNYSEKRNNENCNAQNLPSNNSTIQSHTVPSQTCDDFPRYLYPKSMGECKNGNQEACTV